MYKIQAIINDESYCLNHINYKNGKSEDDRFELYNSSLDRATKYYSIESAREAILIHQRTRPDQKLKTEEYTILEVK